MSVRSDFSFGESSFQIGQIIESAKANEYTHVAVCDFMTISGAPEFTSKAKKAGLTPIIGVSINLVAQPNEKLKDKDNDAVRLKVFPKSELGMQSVYKLLSKGLTAENYYYVPRVGIRDVLEMTDVVITSGDMRCMWHSKNATTYHRALLQRFKDDYFTELVAVDSPLYDRINRDAITHVRTYGGQLVVGRPAMYASPEHAESTNVLRAIMTNDTIDSKWLARPFQQDLTLLSCKRQELEVIGMVKRCAQGSPAELVGQLVTNMRKMVKATAYEFKKLEPCMPKMAEDEFAALVRACMEGWKVRFSSQFWGHIPAPADMVIYKERLAFELGVIKKMGFSGYFLLVQEIVRWSKDNGVMVGPGRGSVGGSLIAYLMDITDVDPIRFNLLFERFINPDRIDLPDADLDFMSARRTEVIDYLVQKYGQDRVAGIVNFSTLGPASALRDAARVSGLSPFDYACSKQMEKEHGVSLSLSESADKVPDIDKFRQRFPTVWEHALRLEGANRNLSQHAAGVVVAGEPVTKRAVVSSRNPGLPVIQWDKRVVEDFGLIKIDVLGLNTLDLIVSATNYIRERHNINVQINKLPLDDEMVLKAFGRGDTTGVFQFSGGGMKKLLRDMAELKPLTFDDLSAATALFRPGPLDAGLCDQYVKVKQGKTIPSYEHPALEKCLSDTYGVIVYQEQVMAVTRELCNFTPGDADGVRKAIGKKDADKMALYATKFVDGAVANGMHPDSAEKLWDTILGFAGYAFNKSHSVAYTLLSWATMWLKVHYPAEFYAASLTVIDKEDQVAGLVTAARNSKLMVLPPDMQYSSSRIEIEGEDKLFLPFQSVKGISTNTANEIVKLRDHFGGRFRHDTVGGIIELQPVNQKAVLGRTKVTSAAVDALRKVGAFYTTTGDGLRPMHPDAAKDRLALMPGYAVEVVKADRDLTLLPEAKTKIIEILEETSRGCSACSLAGKTHAHARFGDKAKFMVVFDCPSWEEERAGHMLPKDSDIYNLIAAGLQDAGLNIADGYFTTLVRASKDKGKQLTNEQINGCSGFLKREIEALKPAAIVTMGSNATKFFSGGSKAKPSELIGKTGFNAELDATVIYGFNPGVIYHDPNKAEQLYEVFANLAAIFQD